MKKIWWTLPLLAVLPVLALLLYKPSRVLFPALGGIECQSETMCVENPSDLKRAENLARSALGSIEVKLGRLSYKPKFIFCETQQCFEAFGFKNAAAHTVGTSATVVGPRGWTDHYLKHEIIHQWQADRLGRIRMLFAPEWIIEGMAYGLSDDPRPRLEEPWQSYRERFEAWYGNADKDKFVEAIKEKM